MQMQAGSSSYSAFVVRTTLLSSEKIEEYFAVLRAIAEVVKRYDIEDLFPGPVVSNFVMI